LQVRALTWNLFHGRDKPPDPALFTWRSRLLKATERNATHVQVNRDLLPEFSALIAGASWDVALLQECPPRWCDALASACDAEPHRVLTSRNFLGRVRAALARVNPDLLASNEGGSNLTLIRRAGPLGPPEETRGFVLRPRFPERRAMAFTRSRAGVCVANLHATSNRPDLTSEELLRAADTAVAWAAGSPLLFGGDFNLRPAEHPGVFEELRRRHDLAPATRPKGIDHLLGRGLEVIDPPTPWPAQRRELREDGLALRLSDHAPVEATFGFAPVTPG
jgi:endonuclease/exonuclease/phosphatase family metal-dependent hydrolase